MTDPKPQYEAPSVEQIEDDGFPIDTAPGTTPPPPPS
jgi:hypothetical protein